MDVTIASALDTCKALRRAGIWLELQPATHTLILGPTERVNQHPALLQQVRDAKSLILDTLMDTLAYEMLAQPDSGRFVLEHCADCQQQVFVIAEPRRLAVHRMANNQTVCPGAIRAQEAVANALMPRFLADRCVQRAGSVITWMALRSGLEPWARDQGVILPPRSYLMAWLDRHYKRMLADMTYASWAGLSLSLSEWLGDDPSSATSAATAAPAKKCNRVLQAS
jgi:hypothetical protein